MSTTYEIERFVELPKKAGGWELVLTTSGFVEALGRFLDELKSNPNVRLVAR